MRGQARQLFDQALRFVDSPPVELDKGSDEHLEKEGMMRGIGVTLNLTSERTKKGFLGAALRSSKAKVRGIFPSKCI